MKSFVKGLKYQMRQIRKEVVLWYRAWLEALPGETGCWMRARFYGYKATSGNRVLSHVVIDYPERLSLGRNSGINRYSQLNAAGGIEIGAQVLIGPNVLIWSQDHEFKDSRKTISDQGYVLKKVTIEDDVWIGAGAIILPGVRLSRGTVVAAGAIVTKSTEPFTIVAGVPARLIGERYPQGFLIDQQVKSGTNRV